MKTYVALAGLLLAVVVRGLPEIDTDTFCDDREDGYYCASCLQPVYCNASATPPAAALTPCNSHYICEQFSSTIAGCASSDSTATCACAGSNDICDPYSDAYLAICSLKNIVDVQACGEEDQKCVSQECLSQPNCTGVPDGSCVHYSTYCNLGYYCEEGALGEEISCAEGTYVSVEGNCTLPSEPCDDSCSGNCPDVTDCHRYYICDGLGQVLSGPLDCPDDIAYYYFDPSFNPPQCVDDPSVCSALTSCGF